MPKFHTSMGFALVFLGVALLSGGLLTGCSDNSQEGQTGSGTNAEAPGPTGMQTGSAATGSEATGSEATGSGAAGSTPTGSEVTGSAATGSGAHGSSGAQSSVPVARTLEEAKERALAEGKPILIDFYADWCGPCKLFNRDSHSDVDVMAALDQVILLKIDTEIQSGRAMAQEYGVRGLPTFVLVSSEGKTITSWAGYAKPFFLDSLNKALADAMPLAPQQPQHSPPSEQPAEQRADALSRTHDAGEDFAALGVDASQRSQCRR